MGWFIVVAIISIIVITAIYQAKKISDLRQGVVSQYRPSELYVSSHDYTLVGLNFNQQKVILGSERSQRSFDFTQIVSVEIVENGATLSSTNRGSQAIGVAVGALALGGVGAIIGGLSGSSRSRSRLRGLSLKVIVDDRTNPVYSICFFKTESKKGADPDSATAKAAKEKLDRIHAQLLNAMRHGQTSTKPAPISKASMADELQKLWDLKQAGILTETEFSLQKARLLGPANEKPSTNLELNA